MNVARHHAEWLSLVETSGPFLSLPVLLRVFPQGLDRRDPDRAARLREAYEDWLERGAKVPAVHHAWVRCVLRDLLEYSDDLLTEGQAIPPGLEATMATFGETLRPNLVLKHRDTDKKPVLLIGLYQPGQDLDKPVAGKLWKATTGTRMMELLHAADVPLGLVTNGEQWMLVSARRGETTGFASWYADLWMQEPLTLQAFHSLMHLRRFVGVAEADALPALFVESSKDQQEVTDQLGYQVRQAVEVLIQAFGRVDAESGRTLLTGVSEKTLYDSALTVMMRLVFLFSAEERGLLLLGSPLYDQNYAVSTLSELLRERADQHGEEVLERRHDAWCRLLSTFRAVHGGVEHEAMRLLAYGGSLFDPDRFPFLEGRVEGTSWQQMPATPLLIDNRVVLHLLEALQLLRVKVPGGGPSEARRLSFRALDIEQIGHVYEGLLDHTAKRAAEPILGLDGSKDKQPEIPLSILEGMIQKGTPALVEFLRKETGRSDNALTRLIVEPPASNEHLLLIACGQDEHLARRVKPFAALLREDSFGRLVVIPTGSVYVTSGSDRRSTGTHYTPRSLTEPIVKHALEPLVYVGPAEGLPASEWTLRSAKDILALKVCDMAMGSGAFLVEACRYLAERLVEAWENAEREHPGSFVVTPDSELSIGAPTERLLPVDTAERIAIARRVMVDRCLYGVDINPMAVEMAKLSLWLITLRRDRPFTFVDHALKCGDSLLGIASLVQLEHFSVRPGVSQITFSTATLARAVSDAINLRLALEGLPSHDISQIDAKQRLHAEAEAALENVKALADVVVALELLGLDGRAYDDARTVRAEQARVLMMRDADALRDRSAAINRLLTFGRDELRGRRTFHWAIEFPEVFALGGFDALIGNPPFMAGKSIGTHFSDEYSLAIKRSTNAGKGAADLCAYFFLRARQLTEHGFIGLLATNTIAQGDTLNVGLRSLVTSGSIIIRAVSSLPWIGAAAVHISVVHLAHRDWRGGRILDDTSVAVISSDLTADSDLLRYALASNRGLASNGTYVFGDGFLLTDEEYAQVVSKKAACRDVLRPYLGGHDVNRHPLQKASRWVIDVNHLEEHEVRDLYPDLYARLVELVVPARAKQTKQVHEPCFWKFWDKREEFYARIRSQTKVLVGTITGPHMIFVFVAPGQVYSKSLNMFAMTEWWQFAVMQSWIHETWARKFSSTFKADLAYTVSKCLASFSFPAPGIELEERGHRYHDERHLVMLNRNIGLTGLYNRFHDPDDTSTDCAQLRRLHIDTDQAVAAAYGWSDLDLGHSFRDTKQGVRFTLSDRARHTVLERLLALNQKRHSEELTSGTSAKGRQKAGQRKARNADKTPSSLFG